MLLGEETEETVSPERDLIETVGRLSNEQVFGGTEVQESKVKK